MIQIAYLIYSSNLYSIKVSAIFVNGVETSNVQK